MSIIKPKKIAICIREFHVTNPPLTWIPDTSPRQDVPAGTGKGVPIRLYPAMVDYIKRHNEARSWNWILEPGGAWCNSHPGPGEDRKAEQLDFGGNYVEILETKTGHAKIQAWPHTSTLPESSNWHDNPTWWMKGSAVNYELKVINPANNIDAYIPSLKTAAAVWMPLSMLEIFPVIPPMIGLPVTALQNFGGNWKKGETFRIYDYKCLGASVLGLTIKGWKYLLLRREPAEYIFTTTWHFNTTTVIPPPLILPAICYRVINQTSVINKSKKAI